MSVASTLARAFIYVVGILSLIVWSLVAAWDGHRPWQEEPQSLDKNVAKAQHDLWSLERNDDPDRKLDHDFLTVREGVQLHYIATPGRTRKRNLIVFLHGFPDSCHIFAHLLSSPLADHANVVSLDLPGFGGSDGLPAYGADDVLNTITSAIALLKERYLDLGDVDEPGQCTLVGHDWGGVISSRLAMETQGLIDRVVIVNAPIPRLFSNHLYSGITICGTCLRTWWQKWSNTQALYDARDALRPVFAQLFKSNYVFMFGLPFFNMRRFRFVTEHLVGFCHRAAAKEKVASWASWSWASSIGPGVHECTVTGQGPSYGEDVIKRALRCPRGDWDTRIRLYKEGLLTGDWTLQVQQPSAGVKQVKEGEEASFQCPASIVFGLQDPALDYRTCVQGVETLFRSGTGRDREASNITLMEDCGHWLPLEEPGTKVLRGLLLELLGVRTYGGSVAGEQHRIRRSDFH